MSLINRRSSRLVTIWYSILLLLSVSVSSVVRGQNAAIISWQPVTHDTSGQFETETIYYNLYCDSIPAFTPGLKNYLAATIDTQYVHVDPRLSDPERPLFYVVQAVDFWGNHSAWSDTVGETGYVLARVKLWLQAPYSAAGDSMTTYLTAAGIIDKTSPYADARRGVRSMPAGTTDWIRLQLYDAVGDSLYSEGSFLLRRDGHVTEPDGVTEDLGFTGVDAGGYRLVARHRNHLAAMARPVLFMSPDSSTFYDFAADSSAYAGVNAARELEPGVWGLWSGDIDGDGLVAEPDYLRWRSEAALGGSGYRAEDLNFDGLVTTRDYMIWLRNSGLNPVSQAP